MSTASFLYMNGEKNALVCLSLSQLTVACHRGSRGPDSNCLIHGHIGAPV